MFSYRQLTTFLVLFNNCPLFKLVCEAEELLESIEKQS